jgi:hypothetical protein
MMMLADAHGFARPKQTHIPKPNPGGRAPAHSQQHLLSTRGVFATMVEP